MEKVRKNSYLGMMVFAAVFVTSILVLLTQNA
jgi:hypothetical protein